MRLIQYFSRDNKQKAAKFLTVTVIGAAVEMVGIGAIYPVLKVVSGNGADVAWLLKWVPFYNDGMGRENAIVVLMVALAVFYAIKNTLLCFMLHSQTAFLFSLNRDLSKRFLSHYLYQPYSFHIDNNSNQLSTNIVVELNVLVYQFISPALMLISEGLVIALSFVLLMKIQPIGTLVLVVMLAGGALLYSRLTRSLVSKWGLLRQVHDARRIKHLNHAFGAIKDVKLYEKEQAFVSLYADDHFISTESERKMNFVRDASRLWIECFVILGLAALIVIMAYTPNGLTSIVPTLGLFVAAAFRFLPSANKILNGIQSIRYAGPVADLALRELANEQVPYVRASRARQTFERAIVLDNVAFQYREAGTCSLSDINLAIEKADIVGIYGPSGSGKSTLINILLGLLKPTNGTVCIDGVDIHSQRCIRGDIIGYVPQSICLLDDTIASNIAFGIPDDAISVPDVERAVEMAQLTEFIRGTDKGLNTVVGERGVRLSGGQMQRIGIARALYRNPEILILDEATASLDYKTEAEVMNAVNAISREKTIIIVAHRLSTLSKCTKLYKMERGRLFAMPLSEIAK